MINRKLSRSKVWILIIFLIPLAVLAGVDARNEVLIPDVPGYKLLKFDLHMHTVFSDGKVWPDVRVKEAWLEGLDGLAITDHIEYLPFRKDVAVKFNRSYEIALPEAERRNLMLFRGGEITRGMPPGHINAIFLKDVEQLDTEEWRDAVKAAHEQDAFIFWNHPGWKGQQRDGISKWYDEHTELFEKGMLHGIEVVNGHEYYPKAHRWCLEKNLTMLGNSDIHDPITMSYNFAQGKHRPMTLILVPEKTREEVRKALFERRTVVYWNNTLIGKKEHLLPIFRESVRIINPSADIKPGARVYFEMHNSSEIDYHLKLTTPVKGFSTPESITLFGEKTVRFPVRVPSSTDKNNIKLEIPCEVENLKIAPDEGMETVFTLEFKINNRN